jgi:hypothetical protein
MAYVNQALLQINIAKSFHFPRSFSEMFQYTVLKDLFRDLYDDVRSLTDRQTDMT